MRLSLKGPQIGLNRPSGHLIMLTAAEAAKVCAVLSQETGLLSHPSNTRTRARAHTCTHVRAHMLTHTHTHKTKATDCFPTHQVAHSVPSLAAIQDAVAQLLRLLEDADLVPRS